MSATIRRRNGMRFFFLLFCRLHSLFLLLCTAINPEMTTAAATGGSELVYGLLSQSCFDSFSAGEFYYPSCWKQLISKALGYAIIVGALVS
jgi:hypothetical protein